MDKTAIPGIGYFAHCRDTEGNVFGILEGDAAAKVPAAPAADLVAMFVHQPGRKLLLAATSGHGFITGEDDAVAMKRSGKQVMNVSAGTEAVVCRPVEGDHVAVVGEDRQPLIFPAQGGAGMARGRGRPTRQASGTAGGGGPGGGGPAGAGR